MLIFDLTAIGQNLREQRKRNGLTQESLAEAAGLAPRTYADIERGSVSPRLDSFLKICDALQILPNEVLTAPSPAAPELTQAQLAEKLNGCSERERDTAMQLLEVYVSSIK